MEWIFIGSLLLFVIAMIRLFPDLVAPRCPLCGAHLQAQDVEDVKSWRSWQLGWHRLSCVQCLYFHKRPIFFRSTSATAYEAKHAQ